MPILPLAQFEADLEADRKAYERLKPPTSVVVRFGSMRLVGEYPYSGDSKPGCGSKLVVRTHRGIEIGEMLTSTCPNAGCSKSVTRKEMLEYIESSGGREYPFFTEGRVLRVATVEDIQKQSALDSGKREMAKAAQARVVELALDMKIIEAEPILGGETLTFFFLAQDRVDFRELVRLLAEDHRTRIELRQVGARDEARLKADYERCGQHCCCKQFLKVLKPISMRSAKVQKSTLDPLKISGRCGRLMCCLRYEDETYETLRKRLPNRGKRVGTPDGPGKVVDSQILTQLVLVELEADQRHVAVAVEELGDPDAPVPPKAAPPDALRGMSSRDAGDRAGMGGRQAPPSRNGAGRQPRPPREARQDAYRRRAEAEEKQPQPQPPSPPVEPRGEVGPASPPTVGQPAEEKGARKRRRNRRGGGGGGGGGGVEPGAPPRSGQAGGGAAPPEGDGPPEAGGEGPEAGPGGERKRRRRGRRGRGRGRKGGGDPGGEGGGGGGGGGGQGGGGPAPPPG